MQAQLMATLEKIQGRLDTYKNHLPPAALERLQRALAEGVGGEKCGSFLADIEEIHREFEAAIVSTSSSSTTPTWTGKAAAAASSSSSSSKETRSNRKREEEEAAAAAAEFKLIDENVNQNYRYYYSEYARLKGMSTKPVTTSHRF